MHPTLARQVRRLLDVAPDDEALFAALTGLHDFLVRHEAPPNLRRLGEGLADLLGRVDSTYAQFERDLELRTRSLQLSSRELLGINEQLRNTLASRESAIARLQTLATRLRHESTPVAGDASDPAGEKSLTRLVEVVSGLVERQEADQAQLLALHADLANQKFALDQHAIVSITDLGGRITYANDRFCEISGYSRAELVGANHRIVRSGHHPRSFFEELWRTITAGDVWRGEVKNRRRDGSHYWVSATIVPLRNAEGAIAQYIGIRTDITERKRIEEELGAQLHFIEELLESIPTPIYLKDEHGRYLRFNRAFGELFGIARREWVGKTVFDLVPGPAAQRMHEYDQELLQNGGRQRYEASFTNRRTGERHEGLYWKARLTRPDGSVTGLVGTILDITERKLAESQLEEAKRVAEAANRAKSDFLANMSHEIRTPMNGIIGMTELALDTELNPTQRDYLQVVRGSAEALLVILNDILDFSKIEAGKLGIERIEFALPATIAEALKSISARARKKGLRLVCDLPPDLPQQVLGDPGRLRQILTNFCDNAIKFTAQGEITVRARHRTLGPDEDEIEIAVSDTGIGIPADKLHAIFEAFAQADTSTTRRYGGTGLGLTICTRLVEMMGGRIAVDSEPGRGSTFRFTVRVGTVAAPLADLPPLTTWPGVRVLVVDDHAINRQTLGHWLAAWGFVVDTAADGPEALARCLAGPDNPYRVILLDAHLPGLDGFGVAAALAEAGRAAAADLLILSSGGERGDAQRCRELGIGAYLMKPATPLELRETLTRLLGAPDSGGLLTRHRLREHQRELEILVAEDHPVNQRLVAALLGGWGHRVKIAANGQEALELFSTSRWDIVFMDMQMPVMGGIEATKRIRAVERERATERTPIVAMTANAMAEDRALCLEAGMDEHLAKPLDVQAVHRLIDHFCARIGLDPRRVGDGRAVSPSPPAAAGIEDEAAVASALDAMDPEILAAIGGVFVEQIVLDLGAAKQALRDGDFATLQRLAHNMKATLATFGMRGLAEMARRIETAPQETAPATLDELDGAIARVTRAVSERIAAAKA